MIVAVRSFFSLNDSRAIVALGNISASFRQRSRSPIQKYLPISPLCSSLQRMKVSRGLIILLPLLLVTFADDRYELRKNHDLDGIGKFYMDREIAQVMGHQGADWL